MEVPPQQTDELVLFARLEEAVLFCRDGFRVASFGPRRLLQILDPHGKWVKENHRDRELRLELLNLADPFEKRLSVWRFSSVPWRDMETDGVCHPQRNQFEPLIQLILAHLPTLENQHIFAREYRGIEVGEQRTMTGRANRVSRLKLSLRAPGFVLLRRFPVKLEVIEQKKYLAAIGHREVDPGGEVHRSLHARVEMQVHFTQAEQTRRQPLAWRLEGDIGLGERCCEPRKGHQGGDQESRRIGDLARTVFHGHSLPSAARVRLVTRIVEG